VFNEEDRLPKAIPTLQRLVRSGTEVVLVDDGSTDGTNPLMSALAPHPLLRVIRLPSNRGKGAAVREGVLASRGAVVTFMDADLATDPICLERLGNALEFADIAIGSRSHMSSELHETTLKRSRLGAHFNRFVRSVTRLDLTDTQCGFKAFRAPVAKLLFNQSRVDGFAFDVELLCLARRHGLRVVEVPVVWTEVPGSKVRMVRDPMRMALDVVRVQFRTTATAPVPCVEAVSGRCSNEVLAALARRQVPEHAVLTLDGRIVVVSGSDAPEMAASRLERLREQVSDLVIERRYHRFDDLLHSALAASSPSATRPSNSKRRAPLALAPSAFES
jgi:hypothetical protein